MTTLVIEAKDRAGGQPQFLYADKRIVDIPGFPDGISGDELSERTYRQAKDALVQFRFEEELVSIEDTETVELGDALKEVVTTRSRYRCRKVIIAFGLLHYPRKLAVLDALDSRKVYYKVPKITSPYWLNEKRLRDHKIALIGGKITAAARDRGRSARS